MIATPADLETRKHLNKEWSQTRLLSTVRAYVTSRDRCHTGHDVRTHSWFDTENAAPATVQVYEHIHTRANEYLLERLHGRRTHFESTVEANKNSTTINTEPISNRKMSKKRNRFHYRPFTDPYKKSAADTVYGSNKRCRRCRQALSSVYFRVMAVTSSPGDISEWPAALAPLSLSSDPLFINNTSTTAHRSLGREKVADNMQEAMPVSI